MLRMHTIFTSPTFICSQFLSRTKIFFITFYIMNIAILQRRLFHQTTKSLLKLDPRFKFKCGLEIHTQLKTKYKLFSLSSTSFNSPPNTNISYYDCALPGTIPKLNPEALYLALKAASALDCKIEPESSFDRKHYFYPDQPAGYQITQYYHPVAVDGQLQLTRKFNDILEDSKLIRIERIQIEQDTGKLTHDKFDKLLKVDLNRTNIPLIELVTKPDFENFEQIRAFLKKYQTLVKYLDICSGDLETGAIRVDVNVSVNGNARVEMKNVGSTGEIHDAIESEYNRQISLIKEGKLIEQETRGWNGTNSTRLRSKEDSVDYRYLPDSELPKIYLDANIEKELKESLPPLPEEVIRNLISDPYHLELKYAKFLVDNQDLLQYYYKVFDQVVNINQKHGKIVNNWIIHQFLGAFNRLDKTLDLQIVTPEMLSELILMVENKEVTNTSAKKLLAELITNPVETKTSISVLLDKYDLSKPKNISEGDLDNAIGEICEEILSSNLDVVEKIKKGKKKSINYLVGLAMKETQGKVDSSAFVTKFKEIISIM